MPGTSSTIRPTRIPGEAHVADRGLHHASIDGDDRPHVGVLALQGDVLEHLRALDAAGARATPVTTAAELDDVEGILIPGGESTTIGRLLGLYGLLDPLRARLRDGLPALGTCAGAILLGTTALHHDGRLADQPLLQVMDTTVRRNAFGRQVASFEAEVAIDGLIGGPIHAVFIRAPWIEEAGPEVEALGWVTHAAATPRPTADHTDPPGRIVVARQGAVTACAFHPELSGDHRLHAALVRDVAARRAA